MNGELWALFFAITIAVLLASWLLLAAQPLRHNDDPPTLNTRGSDDRPAAKDHRHAYEAPDGILTPLDFGTPEEVEADLRELRSLGDRAFQYADNAVLSSGRAWRYERIKR